MDIRASRMKDSSVQACNARTLTNAPAPVFGRHGGLARRVDSHGSERMAGSCAPRGATPEPRNLDIAASRGRGDGAAGRKVRVVTRPLPAPKGPPTHGAVRMTKLCDSPERRATSALCRQSRRMVVGHSPARVRFPQKNGNRAQFESGSPRLSTECAHLRAGG